MADDDILLRMRQLLPPDLGGLTVFRMVLSIGTLLQALLKNLAQIHCISLAYINPRSLDLEQGLQIQIIFLQG